MEFEERTITQEFISLYFSLNPGDQFFLSPPVLDGRSKCKIHKWTFTVRALLRARLVMCSVPGSAGTAPLKPTDIIIPNKIGTEGHPDPHKDMTYNPITEKWSWI